MRRCRSLSVGGLLFAVLLVGCIGPQPGGVSQRQAGEAPVAPAARKRIVASIPSTPALFNTMIAGATGRFAGLEAAALLANAGLSTYDPQGKLRPQLAEEVPTVENGLWRLFPDGRMEVTFIIRDGAQWHDGAPFTTEDLVFTWTLERDQDLPMFAHPSYRGLEAVEARDARTLVTRWGTPNVTANNAFGFEGFRSLLPMPRHLLERAYREDKATFADLPYWSVEFVGTGPFKLREWVSGSHIILDANDRYVLGRPGIDEIEVRFITDSRTLVASILAGTVDVAMGRSLSFEQAVEILGRMPEMKAEMAPAGALTAYPQFFNPTPAALANLEFRRALLHAIEREELVESLMAGQTLVAHSFLHPSESDYRDVEPSIVSYAYDPRRTVQLLEGLGSERGGDGTFRAGGGPALSVEVRTGQGGIGEKATLALADAWKRAGLDVEFVVIPPQREGDVEYKANYPAFEVVGRSVNRDDLSRVLRSSESPVAENRYRGGNRGRYMNSELDAVLDRYAVTIAAAERMDLLRQVVRHVSDAVVMMGLFWDIDATVYSGRLRNVYGKYERSIQTWNAHQWEAT